MAKLRKSLLAALLLGAVCAIALTAPLGSDYPDSTAVSFYKTLTSALEAKPGIQAAGATDTPPLSGAGIFTSIRLIGEPPPPKERPLMSTIRSITPGYFRALGMHPTLASQSKVHAPYGNTAIATSPHEVP